MGIATRLMGRGIRYAARSLVRDPGRQSPGLMLAGLGVTALKTLNQRRMMNLQGKRVLITGGSRGLGLALAREFLQRGASVGLCARDGAELARARESLTGQGTVATFTCDLVQKDRVDALVKDAESVLGGLDVLVNNAGIIQVGPVEAMTEQDFRDAMDANYWGAVHATFAALPALKPGSRIVNITSIGGAVAIPHLLPYTASKFAALGFSMGLCAELAKKGIRVVTIVPGLMRTGSFVNALFKGKKEDEFNWFALGAATPLTAMSARRAAAQIVDACERGAAYRVLSIQAKTLRLLYHLFPGPGTTVLGLVNRVLPDFRGNRAQPATPGHEHRGKMPKDGATRLGDRAGDSLNENPAA